MTDAWTDWHARKEGIEEPEVYELDRALKRDHARKILDIGCGSGRHVLYFAREGFEVSGFDEDRSALRHAEELLRAENLKADLTIWDMTRPLPYQDCFFDAVLTVRVIHHTQMDNIRRTIGELYRVLRRGGRIFLQVPSYESGAFDSETVWVEPGTLIARGGPEKGVPHHFFRKGELLSLFPDYTVEKVHSNTEHYGGYCLVARKNEENPSSSKG